jgi:hypothetical protein
MKRFMVVWTLQRGIVKPPEPLDDAGQYQANLSAEAGDTEIRDTLRRRATFMYQCERDPLL